jgi:Domain of unknown function (DUF6134)
MAIKRSLAVATAAMLLATPSLAAFDEDAGEYTFTVLRDGDPVGRHRFTYEREGDRIEIEEATDIEIKFAMIPLYTFEHEAHQLWQDGRAVRIDATTDDNGEELDITVRDTAQGYVRTVNGRVDRFDDNTAVLAFWNKDMLGHDSFLSAVEDKTLEVSFEDLGAETITVAGQKIEAQHYRMAGDEDRDLWFDPDGHIAKVAFRRYGADIEYVRDQITAAAPGSTCAKAC